MAKSPWDNLPPEGKNQLMILALSEAKSKSTDLDSLMKNAYNVMYRKGAFSGMTIDYSKFARSNPYFKTLAEGILNGNVATIKEAEVKPISTTSKSSPDTATATAAKTSTTTYLIAGLVVVLVIIGIFIFKTSKKK